MASNLKLNLISLKSLLHWGRAPPDTKPQKCAPDSESGLISAPRFGPTASGGAVGVPAGGLCRGGRWRHSGARSSVSAGTRVQPLIFTCHLSPSDLSLSFLWASGGCSHWPRAPPAAGLASFTAMFVRYTWAWLVVGCELGMCCLNLRVKFGPWRWGHWCP